MGNNSYQALLLAIAELKLDSDPMTRWQEYEEYTNNLPPLDKLFKLIDSKAQSSTIYHPPSHSKRSPSNVTPIRRNSLLDGVHQNLSLRLQPAPHACLSETAPRTAPVDVCDEDKHSALKAHHLCFNCLQSGYQMSQCTSSHRC